MISFHVRYNEFSIESTKDDFDCMARIYYTRNEGTPQEHKIVVSELLAIEKDSFQIVTPKESLELENLEISNEDITRVTKTLLALIQNLLLGPEEQLEYSNKEHGNGYDEEYRYEYENHYEEDYEIEEEGEDEEDEEGEDEYEDDGPISLFFEGE